MIDLHVHTNYSGGKNNLLKILQIAEKRNVSIISITDNNTCEAYVELKELSEKRFYSGIIIPGCEFSTIVNNVPIELIGYNINPEFEELGIKVTKTAKLTNILYTATYPVKDEETNLTEQMEDVATLATMKALSEYIRADRNIVLSTNYPFPNFDNQELAMKRMNFVEELVKKTGMYNARGNIKKLSDMIYNKLY